MCLKTRLFISSLSFQKAFDGLGSFSRKGSKGRGLGGEIYLVIVSKSLPQTQESERTGDGGGDEYTEEDDDGTDIDI